MKVVLKPAAYLSESCFALKDEVLEEEDRWRSMRVLGDFSWRRMVAAASS